MQCPVDEPSNVCRSGQHVDLGILLHALMQSTEKVDHEDLQRRSYQVEMLMSITFLSTTYFPQSQAEQRNPDSGNVMPELDRIVLRHGFDGLHNAGGRLNTVRQLTDVVGRRF